MDLGLEALTAASATGRTEHRPEFFRLALPGEGDRLRELLKSTPAIRVHDELHNQLRELVRALSPSVKFGSVELDKAAWDHLGDTPAQQYGVWVYYPWSQRLVHLLDEHEFAQVRTDRNRNKITSGEQAVLATKRLGVIGLSVGQSASMVLAQERAFGELRLADFDTLDLSNLNRIRSGVERLGLNKSINTAREIAEIDPFLRVTCFPEGITEGNIDRFLTEGGRLDLLIEECDSVAVKIIARRKARELRIPVVMDTSDRGLIDVERFDLEPGRPILHGLVDHLDLDLAAKARTNEEKLPFVIPIIGLDTMSTRMKASMLEIETTVTTWPQLASAVVMGGAIVGHVARRILLDQPMPSGRWWIDPDDLFGVQEVEPTPAQNQAEGSIIARDVRSIGSDTMRSIAERMPIGPSQAALSPEEASALALAGSMAPSGGNCQPWKFLHHKGRLFLFMDLERANSALDPGLRYAYLGMGACTENVLLEASKRHIVLDHSFAPVPEEPELIAVFTKNERAVEGAFAPEGVALAEWIGQRCTNRRNSETLEMPDTEASALVDSVSSKYPLMRITIIRDRERIEQVALLCGKAERIRFLNPTCHHDMFVREMRWNQEQTEKSRDGIDVATLELSVTDRTGLRVAADPKAMSLLRHWGTGNVMEKLTAKNIRASSALAIISIPDMTLSSAYAGGRAMERLWLKASSMGLMAHPVGAPIFMGIHGLWDDHGILSSREHEEAGSVLQRMKSIMGTQGSHPFFMLRLGRAGAPTARSLRLPLSTILYSTTPVPA